MSKEKGERLPQCVICDDYINTSEAFHCPKCRKGPLCRKHITVGKKECTSCTIDVNMSEVQTLKRQERGIQGFLRFVHFIFLICSIFFVTLRTSIAEEIPLLENNLFAEHVVYIGAGSILIAMLTYVALFAQRQRITTIESELQRIGLRK